MCATIACRYKSGKVKRTPGAVLGWVRAWAAWECTLGGAAFELRQVSLTVDGE